MPKTLEEILGMIQDPDAKSSLQATISDFNAKSQRLSALESQLQNSELVDKSIANGWREFDAKKKPAIESELKTLREEVAKLRPEAEAAAALRKQIEGGGVLDPKDVVPVVEKSLAGKYVPVDQIDVIVKKAVDEATQRVNFGSLPTGMKILEQADRARREYGLNIPIETFSEAVTRHGGVEQAYNALTADAARAKAESDRAAMEAKHKADIEAARAEGLRMGRQESDTRTYQPEEGGASGIIPLIPPQDKPELQGVNPQTYNPSDGTLAREAAKLLAKQEADGLYGNRVQ